MGRKDTINRLVKRHDPELYCEQRDWMLCVYRRGFKWEPYNVDGMDILFLRSSPHFVFALTDNWKTTGRPVEWGSIPIMNRLKAIDLWNRDLAEESIQSTIKQNEMFEKDKRNSIESFMSEFRGQFKKTFSDVNTASMMKKERKREFENKLERKL